MVSALAGPAAPLLSTSDIRVIAAGKAAGPMAAAALAALGPRVRAGLVAGPAVGGSLPPSIVRIDAAHPLPDEQSLEAGRLALAIAADAAAAGDLLLVLLSGGGSSMLALPAPPLSLADKRRTIARLLRAGVGITPLNVVRKHLSSIKGGRLAAAAGRSLTLALSDVHDPEDDPATIASGPTAVDTSSYADALAVVRPLAADLPPAVIAHLERGAAGGVEETPKPGDPRLRDAAYLVIGNRHAATASAAAEARRRGYEPVVVPAAVTGEARDAGRAFVQMALARAGPRRGLCVIGSGETTVTVHGRGRGGRNQEFVLGAAAVLEQTPAALLASAGTDGIDGPTDAAGGITSSSTMARAAAAGIDLDAALADNDAYAALQRLGDLIVWGPTGTNVGDVHVLLTMKP